MFYTGKKSEILRKKIYKSSNKQNIKIPKNEPHKKCSGPMRAIQIRTKQTEDSAELF